MTLYFAYGSNMSRKQMFERCPEHECLGIAVLRDFALCFPRTSPVRHCGVAGLAERPGAEVWGVVYRLNDRDLSALDGREGYDPTKSPQLNRYNRQPVRVLMNGNLADCLTYFARAEPGQHIPSGDYLATIITGAEENGLPTEYVSALKRIPGSSPGMMRI